MKPLVQGLQGCFLLSFLAVPTLTKAQTWQWATAPTAVSVPNGTPALHGPAIAAMELDAAGNTVVAGNFYGTLTLGATTLTSAGNSDLFVAKLDPSGQWLQAVRAGGSGDDFATCLKLDTVGNAVVGGRFGHLITGATATFGTTTLTATGTTGAPDAFVAQLSPNGQWLRAVPAGGAGADYVAALALDGAGNAVVLGSMAGTGSLGTATLNAPVGSSQVFVARLSLNTGNWTPLAQAISSSLVQPSALALDAAGNAVVAGRFTSSVAFGQASLISTRSEGTFVARLSATGEWTQATQPAQSRNSFAPPSTINALAVDAAGNVTVAGTLVESATFGGTTLTSIGSYDVFVAKLNAAGQWTQAVRAGGLANDIAGSIAIDAAGNTIVTGLFGPYGSFSPSLTASFGTTTLTTAGAYDAFVAKLSPSGQWLQAVSAGGTGSDVAGPVFVDGQGDITVAGSSTGPAVFGATTLANAGGYNTAFVARLSSRVLATQTAAAAEAFSLVPNPATGALRLSWPESSNAARPVQLLDATGREVRRQVLPARATNATIDVTGLVPGLYVVRCGNASSRLQVE